MPIPPDTTPDQILTGSTHPLFEVICAFLGTVSRQNDIRAEGWHVSKDAWQRYEFLGDRVLNLVVAEYLYSLRPPVREGTMTRKMGVVSNESLAGIAHRAGIDTSVLIPAEIRQQQTYGDAVRGGAIEACIGAMYVHAGFSATRHFVLRLMADETERYDPDENYIGKLQERFQQHGLSVPVYREISRSGPPHRPQFVVGVYDEKDRLLGQGTGSSTGEARQEAAREALLQGNFS